LGQAARPRLAGFLPPATRRCNAAIEADAAITVAYTRNKRGSRINPKNTALPRRTHHKETSMTTYFTIADFILIIPMALAGALFVGALPYKTEFRHNLFRLIGALMGVGVAILLVEGLPALV
jgi:hypothetical protein